MTRFLLLLRALVCVVAGVLMVEGETSVINQVVTVYPTSYTYWIAFLLAVPLTGLAGAAIFTLLFSWLKAYELYLDDKDYTQHKNRTGYLPRAAPPRQPARDIIDPVAEARLVDQHIQNAYEQA